MEPDLADGGERCVVDSHDLDRFDPLQVARDKLARIVLDAMYQFVGLLDTQGRTLEINRAALQGAGITIEDIRGTPFWQARWFQVSPESVARQRDFIERAAAGEFIRCDLEVYGTGEGEKTITVDYSLLPVRDDSMQVVYLLAEGRNITEKKRAEAELARKNAELEHLLDQIRQLNQFKDDLFANVSHELRTPLALILGPVEEMLHTGSNLTDLQHRQLRLIQRSAGTLLKHVNDLLDLSKLQAQRIEMQFSPCDLAAFVLDQAREFDIVAAQHQIHYAISVPQTLTAVVDRDKCARMLRNLLSNAFKFTPRGGRIACRLDPVGAQRWRLTVQDNGPGVPPALRQAIFERFRQIDTGNARHFGGTGLGLAITKEFVELLNGTITVDEAPGGGARFQLELPMVGAIPDDDLASKPYTPALQDPAMQAIIDELMPATTDAATSPAASRAPDSAPTRILVVEDNDDMRDFICTALRADFDVSAQADGPCALASALAAPPDLLVTDLMLPGMSGDRLVDLIRAQVRLRDLPILVLSAKDDSDLRARMLSGAVQDYVTKPFSAQELRARIRNLVTMKKARDALQHELASQNADLTQLTQQLIANRRALSESERRWWTIFEHFPVGVALSDALGNIQSANPAFCAMLRYAQPDMICCTLMQLTPVEERFGMQQRMQRLLSGEVAEYQVQRRFQCQDGTLVWASTSVARIAGAPDAEPLLVVVAEDITAHKQAELALARAQAELAQVSRVSTLGELTTSIAHEINQPLAAIVTNGQACQRWLSCQPANEAEVRAAVERIIRDANRASAVIARIRSFVRRRETQQALLDVCDVIRDVLALVTSEAQTRRISLIFHAPESPLPQVLADRVLLQQVILNLVVNGLESLSRSGRTFGANVLVAVRHDADCVQTDVRDGGEGISPRVAAALFEPFQTTKADGMGMGLAISRSIIESHGGRLWFTPNQGMGVTFSFTLPIAVAETNP